MFQFSIRSKIVFFILFPVIASFLYWGIFASQTLEASYGNEITSLFLEIVDSASQRVKLFVTKEVDKVQILSLNPTIQQDLESAETRYSQVPQANLPAYFQEKDRLWNAGGPEIVNEVVSNACAQILRNFQIYEKLRYREIFVTDMQGGLVAATNKTSDYYQADEDWWQRAAADNGKIFVSDIEYDESAKVHSISLGIPIRREADSKLIGIMKLILDINEAFFGGTEFHVGQTGALRVVNEEGRIVYDIQKDYVQTFENESLMTKYRASKRGSLRLRGAEDERLIAFSFTDLSRLLGDDFETKNRWYFSLSQETSEAFEPVRKAARMQAWRMGMVAVILLMAIFYLSRQFTRPLAQLLAHTREIATGKFQNKIEIKTHDEFQELGEAFNQMVQRLERFFQLTEASERRYKTLFESSAEGIIVLDEKTGIIVNANEAFVRIIGKSRGELIGKHVNTIFHLLNPADISEAYRKVMGESTTSEIIVPTEDRGDMTFELVSSVFHLDEKQFIQCVFRDVTQKKQLEKIRNNLIRDVAHELRTPVAKLDISINLMTDEVKKRLPDDERMQTLTGILMKSISRLSATIESILDFSRLQEAAVLIAKEKIPLEEFILGLVDEYRDVAREKKIEIRILNQHRMQDVYLQGDRKLLKMALGNILSNAVKFTEQGDITVQAFPEGDKISIHVRDSGIGISQENLENIFDKFYQVSPSMPGCGIGLAICREIIRFHAGRISAESAGLGRGTLFKIELNAAK